MTKLSVNVNKLATLRNARGKNNPDVVQTSLDIVRFGAHGITVHPRPDERHIRRDDVYALKSVLKVEFNIEGYPSNDFLKMVNEVKPAQTTLVPDPPHVITSNAGFKVATSRKLLEEARESIPNTRLSVFVDPATMVKEDYATLKAIGVDRIELYTEAYALAHGGSRQKQVTETYRKAADLARENGMGINAGHDLDLKNLRDLVVAIPAIDEVSIGHALIADALYLGLEETVRRYLLALQAHA